MRHVTDVCDICGKPGREGHSHTCPRHPLNLARGVPQPEYTGPLTSSGEPCTPLPPGFSRRVNPASDYAGLGDHFEVRDNTPSLEDRDGFEFTSADTLSDEDLLPVIRKGLGLDTSNPKDAFGLQKTPMHLIPGPALVEEANVMGNGAWKYGPYNWREKHVRATVYIAAALRHLHSYMDGASYDLAAEQPNAKGEAPPYPYVHHLGAVRACCGIILDALASGTLIDDRPKPAPTELLILNPLHKVK